MTQIDDPLRNLAFSYVPPERRRAVAALFALDTALGNILRTTRQPLVGQMRLAWWREALERLDDAPVPGEPVLMALAEVVLPLGVSGTVLAAMTDGWDLLLGEPNDHALTRYAELRGDRLFATAGLVLDDDVIDGAGRGWALADLADNLGDAGVATRARALARPLLDDAARRRWPRRVRSLGALTHIARMRLAGSLGPTGVLRLGWHRLTGR